MNLCLNDNIVFGNGLPFVLLGGLVRAVYVDSGRAGGCWCAFVGRCLLLIGKG